MFTELYEIEILGIKYKKFRCEKCGSIFINSIDFINSYGVMCCNCSYDEIFPNTFNSYAIWDNDIRNMWIFHKVYLSHGDKYTQLSEYVDGRTKINFKCNICGNVFSSLTGNIFRGRGCPKCSGKYKYSDEDVKKEIYNLWKDKVVVLGSYKNANTKIKCKCNVCGYEWESKFNQIKSVGCPKCAIKARGKNQSIKKEEFLKRLAKKNNNISLYGEYINLSTETMFKCDVCGYKWKSTPSRILRINECLKCSDRHRTSRLLTQDEFIDRVRSIHGDDYTIIGEYTGSCERVLTKCNKCGNIWNARSSGLMYGQGCPKCTKSNKEKEFIEYLNTLMEFKTKRFFIDGIKREIDAYNDNTKVGFEFDGLYWHSEINKEKYYHYKKHNLFTKSGIQTVHIREDEWDNKREIVESRIKNILKLTENKIYARKCKIYEIPNNIKDLFLEKYHIQGKDKSSVRFGLVYGNKLVSVITFSKLRNSISNESTDGVCYELVRFCNRIDFNVVGGFSKLLKHSIKVLKMLGCTRIKTFADRRWTKDVDNVYDRNGFKFSHISEPGYVYFKKGVVYNRINFQKHKLKDLLDIYNEKLSESENMYNNGYFKIYDCGNLVYYMDI